MEKICKRALEKWGIDKQTDMMIEEMSELTKALLKVRRGESLDNVIDELADVSIVLEQMTIFFGKELVENQKKVKLERLKRRIDG
jgi:NTP pyrophosphatase (non-canonical NTP hydrolase)